MITNSLMRATLISQARTDLGRARMMREDAVSAPSAVSRRYARMMAAVYLSQAASWRCQAATF